MIGDSWVKDNPYTLDPAKAASMGLDMGIMTSVLPNVMRWDHANGTNATGVYLGAFDGVHLALTNQHVANEKECPTDSLRFGDFHLQKARCKGILASSPTYDFAIVEIEVENTGITPPGAVVDWNGDLVENEDLFQIGYPVHLNSNKAIKIAYDKDCRVLSKTNVSVLRKDAEDGLERLSFASGCDASHGDSGSGMFRKRDGKMIGLLHSGTMDKPIAVGSSAKLAELQQSESPLIWTDMTYGTPVRELGRLFRDWISDSAAPISDRTRSLLEKVLGK